jgi:membrane dipeptidase
VDLAHIHRDGFWRAMEVHSKQQPCLVTHTGVDALTPHWRNVDDEQMRAIAKTGGVIGIMFHKAFLKQKGIKDSTMVMNHLEHAVNVAGEDHVGIGSDFDGAIIPPNDLRSGSDYPRLVEHMLRRKWSEERIQKILGGNILRALQELRG